MLIRFGREKASPIFRDKNAHKVAKVKKVSLRDILMNKPTEENKIESYKVKVNPTASLDDNEDL